MTNGKQVFTIIAAVLTCVISTDTYAESEACDAFVDGTVVATTSSRVEEYGLTSIGVEVPHDETGAACVTVSGGLCYAENLAILAVRNDCDIAVQFGCDDESQTEIPPGEDTIVGLTGEGNADGYAFARSCTLSVGDNEVDLQVDGRVHVIRSSGGANENSSSESEDSDDGCSVSSLKTPGSFGGAFLFLIGFFMTRRSR